MLRHPTETDLELEVFGNDSRMEELCLLLDRNSMERAKILQAIREESSTLKSSNKHATLGPRTPGEINDQAPVVPTSEASESEASESNDETDAASPQTAEPPARSEESLNPQPGQETEQSGQEQSGQEQSGQAAGRQTGRMNGEQGHEPAPAASAEKTKPAESRRSPAPRQQPRGQAGRERATKHPNLKRQILNLLGSSKPLTVEEIMKEVSYEGRKSSMQGRLYAYEEAISDGQGRWTVTNQHVPEHIEDNPKHTEDNPEHTEGNPKHIEDNPEHTEGNPESLTEEEKLEQIEKTNQTKRKYIVTQVKRLIRNNDNTIQSDEIYQELLNRGMSDRDPVTQNWRDALAEDPEIVCENENWWTLRPTAV